MQVYWLYYWHLRGGRRREAAGRTGHTGHTGWPGRPLRLQSIHLYCTPVSILETLFLCSKILFILVFSLYIYTKAHVGKTSKPDAIFRNVKLIFNTLTNIIENLRIFFINLHVNVHVTPCKSPFFNDNTKASH